MSTNNKKPASINSIKCQQQPGGNSNFSFTWKNDGQSEPRRMKSRSGSRSKYNILTNENTDMMNINAVNYYDNTEDGNKGLKTNYEVGKPKMNIFNEQKNIYANKASSIKVQNAPGGRSNIVLGTDSSNFEDYRRKR
jgi:hypothetical protein